MRTFGTCSAARSALPCLAALMLFAGCSIRARLAGVPQTFLEDVDTTQKLANLPFDHSWSLPRLEKNMYQKVYFKPIRTDLLPKDAWRRSQSIIIASEQDYVQEAEVLAQYFHSRIVEAVRHAPNKRYAVITQAAPDSLIVEIALTELEFSHPIARAGALAAPVPGAGAAIAAISDPHVSFAARVTDGRTGSLLATAADRKFPPARIIDFNKFTVTSSPREVVSLWAANFADLLDSDRLAEVKEEKWSLLPW